MIFFLVFIFVVVLFPTRYFKERSPPVQSNSLATSGSWLFLVAGSEPESLFPLLFFGVKKDQESFIVVHLKMGGATTVRWGAALYRVQVCRFVQVKGRVGGGLL